MTFNDYTNILILETIGQNNRHTWSLETINSTIASTKASCVYFCRIFSALAVSGLRLWPWRARKSSTAPLQLLAVISMPSLSHAEIHTSPWWSRRWLRRFPEAVLLLYVIGFLRRPHCCCWLVAKWALWVIQQIRDTHMQKIHVLNSDPSWKNELTSVAFSLPLVPTGWFWARRRGLWGPVRGEWRARFSIGDCGTCQKRSSVDGVDERCGFGVWGWGGASRNGLASRSNSRVVAVSTGDWVLVVIGWGGLVAGSEAMVLLEDGGCWPRQRWGWAPPLLAAASAGGAESVDRPPEASTSAAGAAGRLERAGARRLGVAATRNGVFCPSGRSLRGQEGISFGCWGFVGGWLVLILFDLANTRRPPYCWLRVSRSQSD